MSPRIYRIMVIPVVAFALIVAACAGEETSTFAGPAQEGADSAVEDGDLSGITLAGVAALGEDLVLFTRTSPLGQINPVRRSADGTLVGLPPLPSQGSYRVTSTPSTVVVGGVACGEQAQCEAGRAIVYQLADGSGAWEELYSGGEEVSSEAELSTSVGPTEFAVVRIADQQLLLSDDGLVSEDLPDPPIEGSSGSTPYFSCTLGDRELAIAAVPEPMPGVTGIDPVSRASGAVWELRFAAVDQGWSEAAPVPDGVTSLGTATECSNSTMTIYGDSSTWTFDSETRTWSEGSSSLRELTGSPVFGTRQPGDIASSLSGETAYAVFLDQVLRKSSADARWEATEVQAGAVYATTGSVVAIQPSPEGEPSFIELPQ